MDIINPQETGLGLIGWIIVMFAITFLWNRIANKDGNNHSDKENE